MAANSATARTSPVDVRLRTPGGRALRPKVQHRVVNGRHEYHLTHPAWIWDGTTIEVDRMPAGSVVKMLLVNR